MALFAREREGDVTNSLVALFAREREREGDVTNSLVALKVVCDIGP